MNLQLNIFESSSVIFWIFESVYFPIYVYAYLLGTK